MWPLLSKFGWIEIFTVLELREYMPIYICQFSALLATTALLAILFSYNNSLSFFYWHRYFMVSYGLSLGARMRQKKNVYFPLKEDYNGP